MKDKTTGMNLIDANKRDSEMVKLVQRQGTLEGLLKKMNIEHPTSNIEF
jgi:hypothetical protein